MSLDKNISLPKQEFSEIVSLRLASKQSLNGNLWEVKFSEEVMVVMLEHNILVAKQYSERQLFDWLYSCYIELQQSYALLINYLMLWGKNNEVLDIGKIPPQFAYTTVDFTKLSYKLLEGGRLFRQYVLAGGFTINKTLFRFHYIRDLRPFDGVYQKGLLVSPKKVGEPLFYETQCKTYGDIIKQLRSIFGDTIEFISPTEKSLN